MNKPTGPGRTIWKFLLKDEAEQTVEMPYGAKLLHVDTQGDDLCIWASVNPTAPASIRTFAVVPTGGDVPTGSVHVGTALMYEGTLAWHVYERMFT